MDGDSFAHRAYHGLPKTIRRADGGGGGSIVGFANFLLRLYQEEKPRAVFVGWDTQDEPTWRHEAFAPYQSGRHFDAELLEQLDLERDEIIFQPHLLPIPRGILSTIYVSLKKAKTAAEIAELYEKFYAASPMVRLFGAGNLPQIQYVVRTNYCDIGFELDKSGRRLILVSCLDNLLKGASGQAVQNLNVMCGWGESEGLE